MIHFISNSDFVSYNMIICYSSLIHFTLLRLAALLLKNFVVENERSLLSRKMVSIKMDNILINLTFIFLGLFSKKAEGT